MRIGIDALSLIPGRTGGMETFFVKIVEMLGKIDNRNEYVIFALPEASERLKSGYSNIKVRTCRSFRTPGLTVPFRLLYEQIVLPSLIKALDIDVMLYPASISSWRCPCKSLLIVMDFIAAYYAEHFPGKLGIIKERLLPWMIGVSARRATKIAAISEFTKRDLCERFAIPEDRVEVVYLGTERRIPAIAEESTSLELPGPVREPFILFVGYQHLHKNLVRLVRAFVEVKRRNRLPHMLVLAGKEESGTPALRDELDRLQSDSIVDLGLVSSEVISALHRKASLFVYPSLIEGFGLPPLDAMACGVPVAASNAGAIPEVVGDAAILFDPYSEEDIARALEQVLLDEALRNELIRRGYERVSSNMFSWERTTAQIVDLLEQLGCREEALN
jgi:glycosyltransferase involved in cell wall biosynthesis